MEGRMTLLEVEKFQSPLGITGFTIPKFSRDSRYRFEIHSHRARICFVGESYFYGGLMCLTIVYILYIPLANFVIRECLRCGIVL